MPQILRKRFLDSIKAREIDLKAKIVSGSLDPREYHLLCGELRGYESAKEDFEEYFQKYFKEELDGDFDNV